MWKSIKHWLAEKVFKVIVLVGLGLFYFAEFVEKHMED